MFSLKKKKEVKPLDDYLKDWPSQFYSLSDVDLREKMSAKPISMSSGFHPGSKTPGDLLSSATASRIRKIDGYYV
jgi:hypothetical protein